MSFLGSSRRESSEPTLPLTIAVAVMGVVFLLVLGRLWQLQLLRGHEFREFSEKIATDPVSLPAPRGLIRDKDGEVLADNRAAFDLLVTPARVDNAETLLRRLNHMLDMDPDELRRRWDKARNYSLYKPSELASDLSWGEVATLEAYKHEMPGLEIKVGIRRTYPHGAMFAHTIGYLGEVSEEQLEELRSDPETAGLYKRGHMIGKKGVEKRYERWLKGREGLRIVPRNRLGGRVDDPKTAKRVLEELRFLADAERKAVKGHDVYLTIDLGLQQAIAEAFGNKAGAVVAVDVNTGAVRAMYNNPTFDPTAFSRGLTVKEWEALRDNPDHPLNDKALRGMYPPGSTWKLVVAAAALKYGEVTPDEKVQCPGYLKFGNRTYRCWKHGGHGTLSLRQAIQQSCDVYFYKMGLRVGVDRLAVVAKQFGFGEPTGIGINDEKGGLVPTREWKRMNRFEEWAEGETLSVAIGQGFDLVTPIQLATAYAAIANGGIVYQPRIVEKIVDNDGEVVLETVPKVRSELPVTDEVIKRLQEGLYSVVNERGGTAYWRVRIPELPIAGKTGTSQVIRMDENYSAETMERFKDHALFVSYAPYDHPELAIAVVVEHGGHGGSAAGPVAKAAYEYWFKDRIEAEKERKKEERSGKRRTARAASTPAAAPSATPKATPTPTRQGTATRPTPEATGIPESATAPESTDPTESTNSTDTGEVVTTPEVERTPEPVETPETVEVAETPTPSVDDETVTP